MLGLTVPEINVILNVICIGFLIYLLGRINKRP